MGLTDESLKQSTMHDASPVSGEVAKGYSAKGKLGFDESTGLYSVDGHDFQQPRGDIRVEFALGDLGWVQDYEAGEDKSPKNDAQFYRNISQYLLELSESGSIVLLHDRSSEELKRIEMEVQWDLRS